MKPLPPQPCPRCGARIFIDAKSRRWLVIGRYRLTKSSTVVGYCQSCRHEWCEQRPERVA